MVNDLPAFKLTFRRSSCMKQFLMFFFAIVSRQKSVEYWCVCESFTDRLTFFAVS